jgi:hypothetical protein
MKKHFAKPDSTQNDVVRGEPPYEVAATIGLDEGPHMHIPVERTQMLQRKAVGAVGLGFLLAVLAATSPAYAGPTGSHVLSAQDLCNLVWPNSEAMPNPRKPVGLICVRQGGLLLRLARDFPAVVTNTFILEPGRAPELPFNSVRVDPGNPLSDWVIPDCSVPDRIDCH